MPTFKMIPSKVAIAPDVDTVRVDIELTGGAKGHFVVPAGTSTGEDEAKTVGVEQAIINLKALHDKILAAEWTEENFAEITRMICSMRDDLGAEATLGYQMALAWAIARQKGLEPYEFIREMAPDLTYKTVPHTKIQYNITNGGEHAENSLDMQEFMVVPSGKTLAESNRMCLEIDRQLGMLYLELGLQANPDDKGTGPLRGKEGGYRIDDLTQEKLEAIYRNAERLTIAHLDLADLASRKVGVHEFVLNAMLAAIKRAGYSPSNSGMPGTVAIALDPATSEMYGAKRANNMALSKAERQDAALHLNEYRFEGRWISSDDLVQVYADWANRYPIDSIEDGMDENDWPSWMKLVDAIGTKVMLVGDDSLVTQASHLRLFIDHLHTSGFLARDGKVTKKVGILIKLNQNGMLTTGINDPSQGYLGTLEVIRLARKHGIEVIISHRSKEAGPEQNETSIAHLAAAVDAYALKSGDFVQAARAVKEARLADIVATELRKLIALSVTRSARQRGVFAPSPAGDDACAMNEPAEPPHP